MDDPTKGLYGKYRVERVDGKDPGECIVLQLDDPNSWAALRTWADVVEAAGYGPLAVDTRRRVDTYESRLYATFLLFVQTEPDRPVIEKSEYGGRGEYG